MNNITHQEVINQYLINISSSRNLFREIVTTLGHQERTLANLLNNTYPHNNPYIVTNNVSANSRNNFNNNSSGGAETYPSRNSVRFRQQARYDNSTHTHNNRQPPRIRRMSQTSNNNIQAQNDYRIWAMIRLLNNNFNFEDFQNNVIVRPTTQQISDATQIIRFSDIRHPLNTSCPILQIEFQDDDEILQIRHCRHNFCRTALNSWFETSVYCPMCRHDIRDVPPPEENNTSNNTSNNITDTSSTNINTTNINTTNIDPIRLSDNNDIILSNIARMITNELTEQINNTNNYDPSGNVSFEYTFGIAPSSTISNTSVDLSNNNT